MGGIEVRRVESSFRIAGRQYIGGVAVAAAQFQHGEWPIQVGSAIAALDGCPVEKTGGQFPIKTDGIVHFSDVAGRPGGVDVLRHDR